jgi:hypothetical protein
MKAAKKREREIEAERRYQQDYKTARIRDAKAVADKVARLRELRLAREAAEREYQSKKAAKPTRLQAPGERE